SRQGEGGARDGGDAQDEEARPRRAPRSARGGSVSETRRVTLERVWDAAIEDVWELWTTKEGIESWWGPGGFDVTVHELDLRPGGTLDYTMSARDEGPIAYLKSIGRPTSTRHQATYTEIVPLRRL